MEQRKILASHTRIEHDYLGDDNVGTEKPMSVLFIDRRLIGACALSTATTNMSWSLTSLYRDYLRAVRQLPHIYLRCVVSHPF